jgi:hypothetical protein
MFRKAKRLSKRLGINKDRCTEVTASSINNNNNNSSVTKTYSAAEENHGEQQTKPPPFLVNIDRANTRGSATSNVGFDDDDTACTDESTSSNSSNDDQLKPITKQDRPVISKCQSAPTTKNETFDTSDNNLTRQLSMMDTGNLELLLSMETQARMDAQARREKEQQEQQDTALAPRPTKIKFELPVTPPRSRSPANPRLQYPRARPIRSLPEEGLTANVLRHPLPLNNKPRRAGWRQLFSDREDEESKIIPLPITLDSRVKLKLRPLPTFGYVRFISGVDFGKGEYIGVELDHGGTLCFLGQFYLRRLIELAVKIVGNNDGSVNGVQYFDTDHNRGIFCKRHDLEAVPE